MSFHILTRANPDGSYDSVGTDNRMIVRGSYTLALRRARDYSKGSDVMIETWFDYERRYRPDPDETNFYLPVRR